jgi:hypothetical protein
MTTDSKNVVRDQTPSFETGMEKVTRTKRRIGEYWSSQSFIIDALGKDIDSVESRYLVDKFELKRIEVSGNTYFENENMGLSMLCENDILVSVFLFADGKDGFSQFTGKLPDGISFQTSRELLRLSLGRPTEQGEPEEITSTLIHGGWDKYQYECFSVHFTYAIGGGAIELITLTCGNF